MKFILRATESESERESDYETAVEMSHTLLETSRFFLEGPQGVGFVLKHDRQETTSSYLEPDFDHFERTGDVVHVSHTDDQPAQVSQTLRLSLLSPVVPPALTVADWRAWDALEGQSPDEVTHLPEDQRQRLARHETYLLTCAEEVRDLPGVPKGEPVGLTVPRPALLQILAAVEQSSEQAAFEVDLAPEVATMLEAQIRHAVHQQTLRTVNQASNDISRQQANEPQVRSSLGERLGYAASGQPAPVSAGRPALRR